MEENIKKISKDFFDHMCKYAHENNFNNLELLYSLITCLLNLYNELINKKERNYFKDYVKEMLRVNYKTIDKNKEK